MKIRKLQLKNIGVFDDETIEFQPCPAKDKAEIHIFTGENGTGKTTLLMALASFFRDFRGLVSKDLSIRDHTSLGKRFRLNTLIRVWFNDETDIWLDSRKLGDSSLSVQHESPIKSERLKLYTEAFMNSHSFGFSLNFAVFAYSGYRRIKDEKINLFDEMEENPLHKALDFVKDENSKFTVNQWLGRNLSKRALAKEENDNEAKRFDENIKNLEKVISDVVDYEIKFKLKTDLSLVLIKDNQELDFDVLPDGLKSLISWIGDLLMRLDSLKWENDTPIFEREIILFLDEIEVHLHPAWQRKVLPVVQKLFKNSQIFVSTHSPFVVNSIDGAWVYELKLQDGKAKVAEKSLTKTAYSYQTVLREIFDIDERFGDGVDEKGTQFQLKEFYIQRDEILKSNGKSKINIKKFLEFAKNLASESAELQSIVFLELAKLTKKTGESYEI